MKRVIQLGQIEWDDGELADISVNVEYAQGKPDPNASSILLMVTRNGTILSNKPEDAVGKRGKMTSLNRKMFSLVLNAVNDKESDPYGYAVVASFLGKLT